MEKGKWEKMDAIEENEMGEYSFIRGQKCNSLNNVLKTKLL